MSSMEDVIVLAAATLFQVCNGFSMHSWFSIMARSIKIKILSKLIIYIWVIIAVVVYNWCTTSIHCGCFTEVGYFSIFFTCHAPSRCPKKSQNCQSKTENWKYIIKAVKFVKYILDSLHWTELSLIK